MKNLVKILSLTLLVFGLANCGGSGGGGEAEAPKAGIAGDATQITFNTWEPGGANVISWSSAFANLYLPTSNSNCVTGLILSSADDHTISERIDELQRLLNEATVIPGTLDEPVQDGSAFITITYADGSTKNYLLGDADMASKDQEVLSNGAQIYDFFQEVRSDLQTSGQNYCPGKGDNIPTK